MLSEKKTPKLHVHVYTLLYSIGGNEKPQLYIDDFIGKCFDLGRICDSLYQACVNLYKVTVSSAILTKGAIIIFTPDSCSLAVR